MSKTFSVAQGELYRYFISPIAYVYLICFLALNSSLSLYFGGIFTSGNASLKPMFNLLPWIYLIFIPGIAMRLWSEEFKSGTILQIITLPISVGNLVWGKFIAAWIFCSFALLLTTPFVITINILGSPDNAVIFNQYIGAILLSGAMLSISQTASSLTKNQVIALVLAVIINFLFFLSGLEYVLGFFRNFAPEPIIRMISSFSFLNRINQINSGFTSLSTLFYFITIIVMFNIFTIMIISLKTSGKFFNFNLTSCSNCIIIMILLLMSFIGINLLTDNSLKKIQIDFTEEKLFTPSDSTRNILKNIQSPITAKVYYSPILGERNEQIRENFNNLILLLQTYQNISDGKFSYRIYNPKPLSDIEDRAIHAGLQSVPISDINVASYFGMTFSNEDGHIRSIPFFHLQKQSFLEQELTENIYLLEHKPKTLGLITSLPILGSSKGNTFYQSWQIADELKKYYNIKIINNPEDLDNIDVLMIAHPQYMPSDLSDAIYNFSIKGGKILAFFDIATEALRIIGPQTTISRPSDYGNLPSRWGFHFYDNKVVADLYNSSQIAVETSDYSGTTQDLIQFYLTSDSFFKNIPETDGLKRILTTSASVFMPLKDAQIHFIPLAQASPQSQLISSNYVFKNIHPTEILRSFQPDTLQKFVAAHIISKQKDKPFELIVVGDSDLLYDSFWTSHSRIGKTDYNIPLLDNANFVLNALDVLSSNTKLLSLRGKSPIIRPFTTINQTQKQIIRQFRIKEKDIFDQINHIKLGLQEIWNKKEFENRQNFTPDELSIINKIKTALEQKKQELYNIRTELNDNLKRIEFLVKLFNIYTIPSLILFGLIFYKLQKCKMPHFKTLHIDKPIIILGITSLFLLILGIISYSINNQNTYFDYENKPLFPNLSKNINETSQIILKTHNTELKLSKKNNIWILDDYPTFMVNQKRIKSFLSSLLQATIYEKKADKIENLETFGLLPLNNPKSKATSITLKNSASKTILTFDIGNYNIDLSRGALGAYIKLPDKFQIWLAEIDLIDLNLDYHYWSYAHLWNLQFGRFATINKQTDSSFIANIAKILLNTPLKSEPNTKINAQEILSLNITGEFFDNLDISFYKHNQNIYAKYQFIGQIKNPILKKFAQNSTNKFYQIPSENMEKIINVVTSSSDK